MMSCIVGQTEVVEWYLLEPKVKVNTSNTFGDTALTLAAIFNKPHVVETLLQHSDTDIWKRARDNKNALEIAQDKEYTTIEYLISVKVRPDIVSTLSEAFESSVNDDVTPHIIHLIVEFTINSSFGGRCSNCL